MISYFIGKLESILCHRFSYFYDKREGPVIKYRVKIPYVTATDKQLRAIRNIVHVVKAENKSNRPMDNLHFPSWEYPYLAIYLDCKLSQINKLWHENSL